MECIFVNNFKTGCQIGTKHCLTGIRITATLFEEQIVEGRFCPYTLPCSFGIDFFLSRRSPPAKEGGHTTPGHRLVALIAYRENHFVGQVVVCLEHIYINRFQLITRFDHFLSIRDTFGIFVLANVSLRIKVQA